MRVWATPRACSLSCAFSIEGVRDGGRKLDFSSCFVQEVAQSAARQLGSRVHPPATLLISVLKRSPGGALPLRRVTRIAHGIGKRASGRFYLVAAVPVVAFRGRRRAPPDFRMTI